MRASVIRPRFPRPSSGQRESEKSAARRDGHVLFPVNGERHRRRIDRGAALEVPEGLARRGVRSEEHTSELQSQSNLVCRLLLEKKNNSSLLLHSSRYYPTVVMLFFFNDPATTEIYTLPLHDALPISQAQGNAKVKRALPAATATYCFPSMANDIGDE